MDKKTGFTIPEYFFEENEKLKNYYVHGGIYKVDEKNIEK